jgi:hypothetical protein
MTAHASEPVRNRAPGGDGWWRYLETLSLDNCDALVTLAPTAAGPHGERAGRGWPLQRIRYDPLADEIEVAVGFGASPTLRFYVASPRSILVEELDGSKTLRVVDADGLQTVIGLTGQQRQPAPLVEA